MGSWLFEKINKIETLLVRLIKTKRERTQINKIRDEGGGITTNTTEIQRILREYYEKLYANKLDKSVERRDRGYYHCCPRPLASHSGNSVLLQ